MTVEPDIEAPRLFAIHILFCLQFPIKCGKKGKDYGLGNAE